MCMCRKHDRTKLLGMLSGREFVGFKCSKILGLFRKQDFNNSKSLSVIFKMWIIFQGTREKQ